MSDKVRLFEEQFNYKCLRNKNGPDKHYVELEEELYPPDVGDTNSDRKLFIAQVNESLRTLSQSADHLNNRRQTTNNLYWLMNGALGTGIAFAAYNLSLKLKDHPIAEILLTAIILMSGFAIGLCQNWKLLLTNYHIASKSIVVVKRALEKPLPVRAFTSHFGLNDANYYVGLGFVESEVAELFRVAHIVIASVAALCLLATLCGSEAGNRMDKKLNAIFSDHRQRDVQPYLQSGSYNR